MLTMAYSYESETWFFELWEIHEVRSKLSGTEKCQKDWKYFVMKIS